MRLYRLICLLAFVALFVFLVAPVAAQDGTILPAPADGPIQPGDAANTLITDIVAIIASWGAVVGAAGSILVGFAKFIPGLKEVDAPKLSIFVNGLLMVGYWVAQHFGLLPQYQFGLGQIENIGNAVLALVAAVLGSGFIHRQAAVAKMPVVGYKRHDE